METLKTEKQRNRDWEEKKTPQYLKNKGQLPNVEHSSQENT